MLVWPGIAGWLISDGEVCIAHLRPCTTYRHMRAAVLILRGIQIAFPRGGAGASVSKLN